MPCGKEFRYTHRWPQLKRRGKGLSNFEQQLIEQLDNRDREIEDFISNWPCPSAAESSFYVSEFEYDSQTFDFNDSVLYAPSFLHFAKDTDNSVDWTDPDDVRPTYDDSTGTITFHRAGWYRLHAMIGGTSTGPMNPLLPFRQSILWTLADSPVIRDGDSEVAVQIEGGTSGVWNVHTEVVKTFDVDETIQLSMLQQSFDGSTFYETDMYGWGAIFWLGTHVPGS